MLWKQLNFKALRHHGLREPVSHIRAQYLLIQLLKRQEKMKLLMWQMEIKICFQEITHWRVPGYILESFF